MRKTFRYLPENFFLLRPQRQGAIPTSFASAKRVRFGAEPPGQEAPPMVPGRAAPPVKSRNPANKPPFRRKQQAAWDRTRNFTWAMLNPRPARRHHSPVYRRVLLFNNLYCPCCSTVSLHIPGMTSVELHYKPESQWASVLEVRQECGLIRHPDPTIWTSRLLRAACSAERCEGGPPFPARPILCANPI